MGVRPPAPEPGIGADVGEPEWLPFPQQHAEHAVLAWQRADRLPLAFRDPVHHELGEPPVVIGDAEGRVTGISQRARRAHDHLEHVTDRLLACYRQHYLADPVEHLVPAAVLRHAPDVTGAADAVDRPRVLGPSAYAQADPRPMRQPPFIPNVKP
jgi:hypothetical protein